jgi:hypothetical protein
MVLAAMDFGADVLQLGFVVGAQFPDLCFVRFFARRDGGAGG